MKKTGLLPGLFVSALLIAAQGALALHAFEHDPGAPQGKLCGTCVTGSQLAAGGVDTHADEALLEFARHPFFPSASRGFESVHTAGVRQRGPPCHG
jgi:hypothetical protein